MNTKFTMTAPQERLDKWEEQATKMGLSRNGFIRMSVEEMMSRLNSNNSSTTDLFHK